jgi:two-component system LytT family response regulator
VTEIRTLIVDDEALARRRLRRLLADEPDVRVVAECPNGRAAVEALREHEIDLVFLDVQMPGMDGFGVVEAVGAEAMPIVVFVTAYDEYALKAFEVHAVDYLLKPESEARLRAALRRVRRLLGDRATAEAGRRLRTLLAEVLDQNGAPLPQPAAGGAPASAAAATTAATAGTAAAHAPAAEAPPRYVDRIPVKRGGRIFFVRVADVDWFEAEDNYVRLHTASGKHLVRETMSALEDALDPGRFARVHRSVVVNLERVRELQPWFGGDYVLILHDGTRLKLSRTYRDQVRERLQYR